MNKLMTPDHLAWDNFIERLAGLTGINTRVEGDRLTWDCPHSMQYPLSRYLLQEDLEIDTEATLEWFFLQDWWCDCEVFFYSDATPAEREIGIKKSHF